MAEGTRSGSRQRRSDAREKRRALAAKPFEELDEAAGAAQSGDAARSTLKQAAATAALGALAAGVGGAAKALVDRRDEAEPVPEPEPNPEPSQDDREEPQARAGEEQPEEPEEDERPEERTDDSEPVRGATMEDAKQIVAEAKRELEELLGTEVEGVSGFHRSDGGWTVTLEVVKLRRVPETTDVLSSYEVQFDDDRNLVGVSETRRYLRSQVQEG
jgi:hypothetical protein